MVSLILLTVEWVVACERKHHTSLIVAEAAAFARSVEWNYRKLK
jgi:hypothetical protein